jgi:hypothetical protein
MSGERYKVFNKKELLAANAEAMRTNRNRWWPETDLLRAIKENSELDVYPVTFEMIHNDVEMRVRVLLNRKGDYMFLDIPFDTYNKLTEVRVEEEKAS